MSQKLSLASSLFYAALTSSVASSSIAHAASYANVEQMIRRAPYEVITSGVAHRWQDTRKDIMTQTGECDETKTLLVDMNGMVVGSAKRIPDELLANQKEIIRARNQLAKEGLDVVLSSHNAPGYPFAYSCMQKHVDFVTRGLDAYFEEGSVVKGWGEYVLDHPVSIREAFSRVEENFPDISSHSKELLRGQFVIESGGGRNEFSGHAHGILQITPYNLLHECDVKQDDWLNEFAQLHCAYTLLQRDASKLKEPFDEVFSHLPDEKKDRLFANFVAHSYHAGVNHFIRMLSNSQANAATAYYAAHADDFSADDISFGLMFHNYGAKNRGFNALRSASLKYVVDANVGYALLQKRAKELEQTMN